MDYGYQNLQQLFQDLKTLEPGNPEYGILRGKAYDTVRFQENLEHPIPQNLTDLLQDGEVEQAENYISDFLEPEETPVHGDEL